MINILLSTEKINDLQTCPLLYYNKHELRQVPIQKATFLEAGDLIHDMLRIYYQSIIDKKEITLDQIIEYGRNHAAKTLAITAQEVEEVIDDFRLYYVKYARNETWQIDAAEEPFAKVLMETDELRIVVTGKIDLRVTTMNGRGPKALVDHKYEARFNQKPDRDNQPLCYAWAYEINDFIYNRIGKQKDESKKFARPSFCYSPYQIRDWVESVIESTLELYKYYERGVFPRRYTGCNAHGFRCTFYDYCNTSPDNREYKLKTIYKNRGESKLMEEK